MQDLKKHSIKLDSEAYHLLDEFRLKHETYSMAVFRLLKMYSQLSKMMRDLTSSRMAYDSAAAQFKREPEEATALARSTNPEVSAARTVLGE